MSVCVVVVLVLLLLLVLVPEVVASAIGAGAGADVGDGAGAVRGCCFCGGSVAVGSAGGFTLRYRSTFFRRLVSCPTFPFRSLELLLGAQECDGCVFEK